MKRKTNTPEPTRCRFTVTWIDGEVCLPVMEALPVRVVEAMSKSHDLDPLLAWLPQPLSELLGTASVAEFSEFMATWEQASDNMATASRTLGDQLAAWLRRDGQ